MAEADLYTIVKVACDEDLTEQIGRDRYFDLVDHNKVRSFRIKRWTPFNLFKEEVFKEFGIPVQFQRFWLWAKRQNHTYRPHRHVTPEQEARPVGRLRAPKANDAELNLFLEVERSRRGLLKIPPTVCSDDILLFFKLYDPLKEELSYVGRLYVNASGMPVEILAKINGLAGFAPDEDIQLFEEIKVEPSVMCGPVDKVVTFRGSQLGDGDIICFQKSPQVESSGQCGHPDVPSFLKYQTDNGCKYFDWVDPPTCERGKDFGKWIVKKNMDLQKDTEELRRQILDLKKTETDLKGEIRVLKERENEFGQKMEQWQRREEWFVMKMNCMNKKMKEMEDGITVKMEEWKNNEDLNALEMEEVQTQNVELRMKMEEVEAKNVSLRGRNKAMKENIESANLKVKWFSALVVILVALGIVYFGGEGWLKKKLLALP